MLRFGLSRRAKGAVFFKEFGRQSQWLAEIRIRTRNRGKASSTMSATKLTTIKYFTTSTTHALSVSLRHSVGAHFPNNQHLFWTHTLHYSFYYSSYLLLL